MGSILRVGVTINFNISFFANGLQQNIVILKKLLDELDNIKPFYIWEGNSINENFVNKDDCIAHSDLLKDDSSELDLIIMMGFSFKDKFINTYKNRYKKSKFVLMQCGNQYVENMYYSLFKIDNNRSPVDRLKDIDQIWVLPHYKKNIPFMKSFYKKDNVISVPYIWDSFFLDQQIKKSIVKDKQIDFYKLNKKSILIMEPNHNSSKNCILPLFIVEAFEQKYPNILDSCNVFCGKRLLKNEYFIKLILQMDIYDLRKDFLKVRNRVPFLDALLKFGSIVLSHQQDNALNYLYLEALYLNLPLLHNSEFISEAGYFYPDNDTEVARDQLDKIVNLHVENIENYKSMSRKILDKFSYKNIDNKKNYHNLIAKIFKK